MKTVVILGSRNPEGQTARAARAFIKGVVEGGGEAEEVFLPERAIERCRQCEDNGWGLCRKEGRCVIEDDLASIVDHVRQADAVVFATPVYFGDLSESLRAFLDRQRRICCNEKGREGIAGTPAVGICVAGGSGGGAPECCASLTRSLLTTGFDAVDMHAVKRQNLEQKAEALKCAGRWLCEPGGTAS